MDEYIKKVDTGNFVDVYRNSVDVKQEVSSCRKYWNF